MTRYVQLLGGSINCKHRATANARLAWVFRVHTVLEYLVY